MPKQNKTKVTKNTQDRKTRKVPVIAQTPDLQGKMYTLHIPHNVQEGGADTGIVKPVEEDRYDPLSHSKKLVKKAISSLRQPVTKQEKKIIGRRIWNTLEWLATSAIIFLLLFFAVNYSSYSQLFMLKLNQLRGQYSVDPFIQKLLQPAATEKNITQELLPQAQNFDDAKKQIPPLVLEVAPPDDRIIIPRINQNVPIVNVKAENLIRRDWGALEKDIQEALREGVVHYPGTSQPGQHGNVVITGHSSYFPWDPGRFKDVFALLHEVVIGDTIIVYENQSKYLYRVDETKIVLPSQVDILTQQGDDRLTLITCTPVGTNLKRLIVIAHPIR